MSAIAMRTERVTIGAVVVTPSRRRPWKLARETQALDHLSGGRLVLPVYLFMGQPYGPDQRTPPMSGKLVDSPFLSQAYEPAKP